MSPKNRWELRREAEAKKLDCCVFHSNGGTEVLSCGGDLPKDVHNPAVAVELRIAADGTISAMHSDALQPLLRELGSVHVERASHVEPVDGTDTWGVWTRSGKDTGKRFATRAEALAWEVEQFWTLINE